MPYWLCWDKVAPHVGAWIEIQVSRATSCPVASHPTWVRGLKLPKKKLQYSPKVAPHVGAWIEIHGTVLNQEGWSSHPTWVRGLKFQSPEHINGRAPSHPTWVRGLKSNICPIGFAGTKSHPTWVRGLKFRSLVPHHVLSRRTPRGCVD